LSDQQAGADTNPPRQPPILPLGPWCVAKIKSKFQERRAQREKEKAQERSSRITANATIVIAFFALVAAIVGGSQAIIANRQLTAMQGQLNAMEADQRPWIKADIEIADSLAIGPDSARTKLRYSLENTGRTPAFNVVPIPEIVAQISGGYLQDSLLPQPFTWPVNPITQVKKSCDKYGPDISRLQQSGFTLLFGNTIFPQKTISHDEVAEIHFPAAAQYPSSLGLNNLVQMVVPRTMNGSVYLISCVVYRVSTGTTHHQTGDVFYIQRTDPNDPEKTIDIDLTVGGVVPKGELRLVPEALGAYAN
jgi:hypothetical protein